MLIMKESRKGKHRETPALSSPPPPFSPPIVVGIGASAGGLEALEQFFRNMSSDSGLAFVVIQHLSPDYKSLMVELISKYTSMPVYRIEDGMKVEPNSIYVIPPKHNVTLYYGHLYLHNQDHSKVLNLPIDIFLRSLAEDQGDRSIAIILSGTGSDGTLGIRAIKGAGGMVMVQDETTAKFDGMPRSAISTGLVDYILPPDQMPEALLKFLQHPYMKGGEANEQIVLKDQSVLLKILGILRERTNIDFTFYKPNTIVRRIERRMSIHQMDSADEYIRFLQESPTEVQTLYKDLLIGVTRFFRDVEAFETVAKKVICPLLEEKNPQEPVRVWSVGCSTGEEPYSLAMLFHEVMEQTDRYFDIKIFATDLDRNSIETAGIGIYPESIVTDVQPDRLARFFTHTENGYQVKESIRRLTIFAQHNIIRDPPFSKIDLLVCRNMLIYLQPGMQKKVLSLFEFALQPRGYLFLGSSESIGESLDQYETISSKWKIYRYNGTKILNRKTYFQLNGDRVAHTQAIYPILRKTMDLEEFLQEVTESAFTDYLPPSLIVNEAYEVVHTLKDPNRFLKIPTGRFTQNILKMVRPELAIALSTALHKAEKEKKEYRYRGLQVADENGSISVELIIRPVQERKGKKTYYVIIFQEQSTPCTEPGIPAPPDIESQYQQRIHDLEQELMFSRENLQATIEELEAANEELQATNEELIASNEELQSTNEELQSVNEELYTVNSEHQNKIEELTQLNNDLFNLLKNTDIGTLFLDKALRIRKFTPAISQVLNILETDTGRPIHHINHNLNYPNFFEDLSQVLADLKPLEQEVESKNGEWFIVRILPYRTIENIVDGLVVTVLNITERKKLEKQIERERDLLMLILDTSPIARAMVDKTGKIVYANKKAEEVLGLTRSEIHQRTYNDPAWKITDLAGNPIPDSELPFPTILRTKKPLKEYIHAIQWPDGRRVPLRISGVPLFGKESELIGAIFMIELMENS